jgi:hypothetical protein
MKPAISPRYVVNPFAVVIYPNPGAGYFTVKNNPQKSGVVFRLYDSKGRLVMDSKITSTLEQRNVEQLLAGLFLWQITYKGEIGDKGKWIRE